MPHHFQQTCAYFTAAKYMRAAERLADHVFAPTGMKPAYSYIMLTLVDQHPTSITQLAETLGYERSSMSRMIKQLAAKQLVSLTTQGRTTQVDLGTRSPAWLPLAEACLSKWGETTNTLLGENKVPMVNLLVQNTERLNR